MLSASSSTLEVVGNLRVKQEVPGFVILGDVEDCGSLVNDHGDVIKDT